MSQDNNSLLIIRLTKMIFRNFQRLTNLNSNSTLQTAILFGFSDNKYKIPYNINYEQHQDYLRKVEKAQKTLEEADKVNLVPRRKRRIYDRPRHDLDISDYTCFRQNNPQYLFFKLFGEHCSPVSCKIMVQPKWLVHAFGRPSLPFNNPRNATGEYMFRDLDMGTFLLYDYRMTTAYKDNIQGYNYKNQSHLKPRMRLVHRLTPEQFWKSQKLFNFRVNSSVYAYRLKFREWVLSQVQKRKTRQSYDEYIDKKHGRMHTFNVKGQEELFVKKQPLIKYVTPQVFTAGLQNVKKADKKGADAKAQKKKKKGKKQEAKEQESEPEEPQPKKAQQEVVKQVAKQDQKKSQFKFSRKLDQQFRIAKQISRDETLKYYAESK